MEKSANGEKMLPADYDKLDYEEIKDRPHGSYSDIHWKKR